MRGSYSFAFGHADAPATQSQRAYHTASPPSRRLAPTTRPAVGASKKRSQNNETRVVKRPGVWHRASVTGLQFHQKQT
jgi:hypothetical protein